jgi:hypothetical protein
MMTSGDDVSLNNPTHFRIDGGKRERRRMIEVEKGAGSNGTYLSPVIPA